MFPLETQPREKFTFLFPQFATLMFKKLPHLRQKVYRVENAFLLTYFWKNIFYFFTKKTRGAPRKKI